jgi:tRNA(His) 5'-end guanylyltransferase
MKTYYEQVPKFKLYRRMPVAIRLDGKAFHTFTRGFQKPFDEVLGNAMARTMEYLCKNIQGCVFAYQQSDEITLILVDYQTFETDAWFDYEVQKICSISASMATMAFNRFFNKEVIDWYFTCPMDHNKDELWNTYMSSAEKGAMFDARCFNIPKEEVCNLIYWRQLDATRNSIQMVGQANFSHAELQNKTCNMIQDMLHEQKGINWNDYPTRWKRGVACHKVVDYVETKDIEEKKDFGEPFKYTVKTTHFKWEIDWDMPILKGEDRDYVDKLIYVGE